MKHHIRACLFDLDGVVVFTDKYHYLGWKRLADEEGWDFDEEVNHGCRGIPRMASLQVILDHNNIDLPEERKVECATRKNSYYIELLQDINDSDLYPGVIPFLQRLTAEGIKLGLCSSSRNAEMVLDKLDLRSYFGAIVTGNDIVNAKPHPEIFLRGAEMLGVPTFHCIVFEDAVSGIEAAYAANTKPVGVGHPDLLPNAPEIVQDYAEVDIIALLDTGRPERPPVEPWEISETVIRSRRLPYWETIFALSNGLIGMRGALEEEEIPGNEAYPATFVNGIVGYEKYTHIWGFPGYPEHRHAMLNICNWQAIELVVDGTRFALSAGQVSEHRRTLDLKRGILQRSLLWESPSGKKVRIASERLVSMADRHRAAINYTVTALDACNVELFSRVHLCVASQIIPGKTSELIDQQAEGNTWTVTIRTVIPDEVTTTNPPYTIGMGFSHTLNNSAVETCEETCFEDNIFSWRGTAKLEKDQSLSLNKIASFYSSIETPEAELHVCAATVGSIRYPSLKDAHTGWWQNYWQENDIVIEGNELDQQALRFSLFQLRQSHPEDDRRSIGANGMTGDKYCGHVFWDTEMYIAPHFFYSDPKLVRPLLMYRYHLLNRARERATQMDGKGALYSWNTITGEECGVVYEASTAEYHLASAIAYAISRYVDLSSDKAFLHDYGAEILFETARFLENRGAYIPARANQFCLNVVCGPDEYGCGVSNNCYTNVMARWHFRYAERVHREMSEVCPEKLSTVVSKIDLKEGEPDAWVKAADAMYIPFNKALGIHEQDDEFLYRDPVDMNLVPKNTDIRETMHPLNLWRTQVLKQADVVLLMFVQSSEFPEEVKRANYEFYEPKTNHGSSLSASIHSILANELGKYNEAYNYFRQSVSMDLNDFKNNTCGGVHSACLGGTWMAVVNGFAGMRNDPEDVISFSPTLPDAWKSYSFSINYKSNRLSISVNKEGATYRLIGGEGLSLRASGRAMTLSKSNAEVTMVSATR